MLADDSSLYPADRLALSQVRDELRRFGFLCLERFTRCRTRLDELGAPSEKVPVPTWLEVLEDESQHALYVHLEYGRCRKRLREYPPAIKFRAERDLNYKVAMFLMLDYGILHRAARNVATVGWTKSERDRLTAVRSKADAERLWGLRLVALESLVWGTTDFTLPPERARLVLAFEIPLALFTRNKATRQTLFEKYCAQFSGESTARVWCYRLLPNALSVPLTRYANGYSEPLPRAERWRKFRAETFQEAERECARDGIEIHRQHGKSVEFAPLDELNEEQRGLWTTDAPSPLDAAINREIMEYLRERMTPDDFRLLEQGAHGTKVVEIAEETGRHRVTVSRDLKDAKLRAQELLRQYDDS